MKIQPELESEFELSQALTKILHWGSATPVGHNNPPLLASQHCPRWPYYLPTDPPGLAPP